MCLHRFDLINLTEIKTPLHIYVQQSYTNLNQLSISSHLKTNISLLAI